MTQPAKARPDPGDSPAVGRDASGYIDVAASMGDGGGEGLPALTLTGPLLVQSLANSRGEVWEPFLPGIERRWLYCATPDGPAAALLRFQPGACVPLHEHRGYEHIFVLEGEQTDDNGIASAGALLVHPPGTRHRVTSVRGCLVLAIYEKPVRFIEPLPPR